MHPPGTSLPRNPERYESAEGIFLNRASQGLFAPGGDTAEGCRGTGTGVLSDAESRALGGGAGAGGLAGGVVPASAWGIRAGGERGTGAQRALVAEQVLFLSAVGEAFVGRAAIRGGESGAGGVGSNGGGVPVVECGGASGRWERWSRRAGSGFLGAVGRLRGVAGDARVGRAGGSGAPVAAVHLRGKAVWGGGICGPDGGSFSTQMAAMEFRKGFVGWNLAKGTEPNDGFRVNLNSTILSVPFGRGGFYAISGVLGSSLRVVPG